MKRAVNDEKVFVFEMHFLLFVLMICFSLPQDLLAASFNNPKTNERTTNEGYVFNNVYNSGLSTSQAQEILQRLKAVEQELNEIDWKGPSKVRCPPGWKVFNGSCFFAFIKLTATWNEARYVCRSLGGDLAKITSAAENTFAYSLISGDIGSLSSGYVYIGLKKGGDGNFYWVDGSSLTSPFWDKGQGQPGAGPRNCAIFWRAAKAPSKWHDTGSCDTKGGFICGMASMN